MFNNLFKITEKKFYVEYISKEDGRPGAGYYCDTREEAEAKKAVMEEACGAQLWDVVITEK